MFLPPHPYASPPRRESRFEARIGYCVTDREVINHLSRERAGIPARRGFRFVLPELRQVRKVFFAGFRNQWGRLALVSVLCRRTA